MACDFCSARADKLSIQYIPENWRYHDIRVYAYITKPIKQVSTLSRIRGAWITKNKWNDDFIKSYSDLIPKKADNYFQLSVSTDPEKTRLFTCEDFVITLIMDFAETNSLPFSFKNGTGAYNSNDYLPNENYESLGNVILRTSGASDIENNGIKIIDGYNLFDSTGHLSEIAVREDKSLFAVGNLLLYKEGTDRNQSPSHVSTIVNLELIDPREENYSSAFEFETIHRITTYEGNFGAASFGVAGYFTASDDPSSNMYRGSEVIIKTIILELDKKLEGSEVDFFKNKLHSIYKWNFHQWNNRDS